MVLMLLDVEGTACSMPDRGTWASSPADVGVAGDEVVEPPGGDVNMFLVWRAHPRAPHKRSFALLAQEKHRQCFGGSCANNITGTKADEMMALVEVIFVSGWLNTIYRPDCSLICLLIDRNWFQVSTRSELIRSCKQQSPAAFATSGSFCCFFRGSVNIVEQFDPIYGPVWAHPGQEQEQVPSPFFALRVPVVIPNTSGCLERTSTKLVGSHLVVGNGFVDAAVCRSAREKGHPQMCSCKSAGERSRPRTTWPNAHDNGRLELCRLILDSHRDEIGSMRA